MKRLTSLILSAIIFMGTCVAQTTMARDNYFPYPTPPESLPYGRPRANYMVEHFWDHCPWKSAFSARKKMQKAFEDYVEFFTISSVDTVYASIDKLIDQVKKRPTDLLELTKMAEAEFYCDTAKLPVDDLYLPFAKALASTKKVDAAERARVAQQASVIENSQVGKTLPNVPLILADGSTMALNDTTAGANEYVLIFDTPGSSAARLNRIQMAANVSATELVNANVLKPLFIYPGTPDASWWKENEDLPETWTLAAMPDFERYIDMRMQPAIIVADSSKRITEKFMTMPLLLAACEQIMNQLRREE